MTESEATGPSPAATGPRDAPPHAGQVVRRVLLRRNIVVDTETAQLVAAAVQAALQAGAPSHPLADTCTKIILSANGCPRVPQPPNME